MKTLIAFVTVAAITLLSYGCVKAAKDDYTSLVVESSMYDNIVSRVEADSTECINLNSNRKSDGNPGYFGTFSTVNGKPICGIRADMTTADGQQYSLLFNRFELDATAISTVENGEVGCKIKKGTCTVRDRYSSHSDRLTVDKVE